MPRNSFLAEFLREKLIVTGHIELIGALKTYAFTMDLEQLAPLRPFASVLSILLFIALFKYLGTHPKYSKYRLVQNLNLNKEYSRQDQIYILKVFVGISAVILVIIFGSILIF